MRLIGTIRSTATERITVEADTYEQAREQLYAQIPEGHELIVIRTDSDTADAISRFDSPARPSAQSRVHAG